MATAGLLWRAVDLQLTHQTFLQHQGAARYLRVVSIPAHRGNMVDRNGEPLAISTPVQSVWANPARLARERKRWPALTQLLGLEVDELHRLVAERMEREFVYLKRHVEPMLAARVTRLGLDGVHLQREYRRYYPTGEVAAHVTGFTNVDDVGQEGLELAFEDWLRGVDGSKRVLRDRLGRTVEDVERIRAARPGRDLVLSVDRRVQYLAYRALKSAVRRHRARSGSAVVLDARTGEVLAMVNQPSYNPNNRAERVGRRYRNRAVTDVFEPGSAVKPFTIASALETGRFTPDTPVDTRPGLLKVGQHTVRDLRNYGVIDVATVIQKSSNVGASKIALAIPPKTLWRTFTRAGFGQPTGSGFPGESAGILTHFADWSDIHRVTLSFGYGLSVTPLQLAQAYAAVANRGVLPSVTFQRVDAPVSERRVLSERVSLAVRTMMENVVSVEGTGRRAAISGYRVAGKTGTARKSVDGGYAEDRYIAVFAGMAPASAPRLVAVVVVDEPRNGDYYGGVVAAPVFAEIMQGALRLLGVPPDAPDFGRSRVVLAETAGGRAP
ncbi:MAG: penicillin-binding protein 2 [Gammaproteobacteria bacterium]|nr:penicillin-binding protein 2 [Gammaproteobacteria bacterium]NIR82269.1 penicillin-binding protein 2 [Gammaproteobacteria bacterium]NIR91200.1 penicillin-binding protein 2 [Gammaproteobacteria bacterium]NIU03418.1 penicillin-binding protein 2 [Gammaproteobacteria bacterium]NIX84693.1 penicillin-binding protein 2 [Gammaproteobacteria bacterium]